MRGKVRAVICPILPRLPPTGAQMVPKQAGDWTVLHCAHRATTALSWGLCEHEGWSGHLLQFFVDLFPLAQHSYCLCHRCDVLQIFGLRSSDLQYLTDVQ